MDPVSNRFARPSYPWPSILWTVFWVSGGVYAAASNATVSPLEGVDGVGIDISCRPFMNDWLGNTSEYDKVASAAATTVMTLLPALLTYASLPTARVRGLLFFNIESAMWTAAMTFGLGIRSIATVGKDRVLKVNPDLCGTDIVAMYGRYATNCPDPKSNWVFQACLTWVWSSSDPSEAPELQPPEAPELPENSDPRSRGGDHDPTPKTGLQPSENPVPLENTSLPPRHEGHDPTVVSQPCEHPPALGALHELYQSGALQTLQQKALQLDRNTDRNRPTRLFITFLFMGFFLVQCCLFAVLNRGLHMIDQTVFIWICPDPGFKLFFGCLGASALLSCIVQTIVQSSAANKYEVFHLGPLPSSPSVQVVHCEGCSVVKKLPPSRTLSDSKIRWRRIWGVHHSSLVSDIIAPHRCQGNYWVINRALENFKAQLMAPHAMVVVLQLSDEASTRAHPLMAVLIGWLQAMMLVFLTFLFGSIVGGTLFLAVTFVVVFMSTITASRACSIYLCSWLETALDLTIIECGSHEEMNAITRILAAMPDVLVESKSDGYRYSGGYRIYREFELPKQKVRPANFRTIGRVLGFVLILIVCLGLGTGFIVAWHTGEHDIHGMVASAVVIGSGLGCLLAEKIRSEFEILSACGVAPAAGVEPQEV